jgi:hypothetical protein
VLRIYGISTFSSRRGLKVSQKTSAKADGRQGGELLSGLERYTERTGTLLPALQKGKIPKGRLAQGLADGRKKLKLDW